MNILEKLEQLRKEAENIDRRIFRTQEQLEQYDRKYQVMDSVTGGMGGTQHYTITGFPYPEYRRKKKLLLGSRVQQKRLQEQYLKLLVEAEQYINGMERSRIRLILRFRYIDGMKWDEIAEKLDGKEKGDLIRIEVSRL